jgi:alcohol dehydrogenase class IV
MHVAVSPAGRDCYASVMFSFAVNLPRVAFGENAAEALARETARLGLRRVLLCCTRGARSRAQALGGGFAGVFDGVEPHCPEPVVKAALDAFRALGADGVTAFGGGSAIGLGKVIALETGHPLVAVPTTYSGSEMTALYGMLVGEEKRTWRDEACMARAVIYDPALTFGLSAHVTATTGMNAAAHCVEALYPERPHPFAALLAEAGLKALASGLAGSVARPDDRAARAQALYGAFLGGAVLALAGIALHHKICHVLGGRHRLPHGESNAVVLPHVVAYNRAAAPAAMAAIGRALATDDPAGALFDLAARLGAPQSLEALGMAEADLDRAAELSVKATAWNPRPVDAPSLRRLLDDAYHGRRPRG